MSRSILASLSGSGADRTVLETALAAAGIDGGHVTCLHARIDNIEAAAMIQATFPQYQDGPGVIRRLTEEEGERSRHARAVFDDVCKSHGIPLLTEPKDNVPVSMSWKDAKSVFDETVEEARFHDLIVMASSEKLPQERLKTVLLHSGRPLLLAPPKLVGPVGRNVAIAWKAGAEAARAVTAAAQLLARAQRVFILSISSNEADDDSDRLSAERLVQCLRWQGIKAEVKLTHVSSDVEARTLQSMSYDVDADLLVMGAYGHSRLREYVLGGVTEDTLAGCAIPVFMFR